MASVPFESPIKLYPSDKVIINNKKVATAVYVGHPEVTNFRSY